VCIGPEAGVVLPDTVELAIPRRTLILALLDAVGVARVH
jgi:hypothetical protein